MRKLLRIMIILASACAVAAAGPEELEAYKYAYTLVPHIYPNTSSDPATHARIQAGINQMVTAAADKASGNNKNHPCYAPVFRSITAIYSKHYTAENVRSAIAAELASKLSAAELKELRDHYTDPVIQRLNRTKVDMRKYGSTEEINKALVASGEFTKAEVQHLSKITTRTVYNFNRTKKNYGDAAIAKVKQSADADFAALLEKMKKAEAQAKLAQKLGCSLEAA